MKFVPNILLTKKALTKITTILRIYYISLISSIYHLFILTY